MDFNNWLSLDVQAITNDSLSWQQAKTNYPSIEYLSQSES